MSTLENTISMMEALPESDLLKIQDLIKKLFQQREHETVDDAVGQTLKPLSRDELLNNVAKAEEEIRNNKCRSAKEVFDGLERRYGF